MELIGTAIILLTLCLISEFGFKQHVDYIDTCILSGVIYITQKNL